MKPLTFVMLSCAALTACGDTEPGQGTVEVTAYGESFIEEGIPASEVRDGWAVQFTRFEVHFRDITVAGEPLPDPAPIDLTKASGGAGHVLGALEVKAGRHTDASFTIAALHVAGRAEKGQEVKTFDWTFDQPVRYHACETTTDVEAKGTSGFEITLHADHLLYDSLVSEEPELTFQAFADADTGDGIITREELAAASIGGLDPGNADIEDLWAWLVALVETLGHVDGEGHCHAEPTT